MVASRDTDAIPANVYPSAERAILAITAPAGCDYTRAALVRGGIQLTADARGNLLRMIVRFLFGSIRQTVPNRG